MKTRFLIILFFLLSFINVYSQGEIVYKKDSITAAKNINGAIYIFEGKIIRKECYLIPLDRDKMILEDRIITKENYNGEIYGAFLTSCIIQITKVIKGDIKEGTVEIILEYGGLGDAGAGPPSHSIGLGNTGIGIFLCNTSKFKSIGFPLDNNIPLKAAEGISYYPDGTVNGLGLSYTNPKELYQFMQRQPNIILKDTSIHPIIHEYFNIKKNNIIEEQK